MALNPIALGVFGSYFSIILGLFAFIVQSLVHANANKTRGTGQSWRTRTFVVLCALSYLHTWYYMFAFMKWSFDGYESTWPSAVIAELSVLQRISNWTTHTALFEQAWAVVCETAMNWWWSEQLCIYTTGAWTVFLFAESRRYRIPHAWAYMLLGQVVAISVASNLFHIAVLVHSAAPANSAQSATKKQTTVIKSPHSSVEYAPILTVWVPVLLSLWTVHTTPSFSGTPYFLPNLLTMHVLLLVPLLFSSPTSSTASSNPRNLITKHATLKNLYTLIALISTLIRAKTLHPLLSDSIHGKAPFSTRALSLLQDAVSTLFSHPAQSSIGFDVVWTSISFLAWCALAPVEVLGERRGEKRERTVGRVALEAVSMLGACVVTGVGVVAADYLRGATGTGTGAVRSQQSSRIDIASTGARGDETPQGVVGAAAVPDIVAVSEISSDI